MKYSIRSAMFLTTAASLLFAAVFFPNEGTACTIVCAFVIAIAIAWLFVIERWPHPDPWTLGFAISGVCLCASNFTLPGSWMNQLTGWLHGPNNNPGLGIRRLDEDFRVIVDYGSGILVAALIATVLSIIKPKSFSPVAVATITILTFATTWFVSNVMLLCVSIALVLVLSWAWFVVSQQPIQSNRWLVAFAVTTTTAVFCLKMHLVPTGPIEWLYGIQHVPPDNAAQLHQQWYLYNATLRTSLVLCFGVIVATLFHTIIDRNRRAFAA